MADLNYLDKQQFDLTPETPTDVYTCPAGRKVTVSIQLCNRANTSNNFRVSVGMNAAAEHLKQYEYYDTFLPANNSLKRSTILNEGDVLRVRVGVAAQVTCTITPLESQFLAT